MTIVRAFYMTHLSTAAARRRVTLNSCDIEFAIFSDWVRERSLDTLNDIFEYRCSTSPDDMTHGVCGM